MSYTGISLNIVPKPETVTMIMLALDNWFECELGIKLTDNVDLVDIHTVQTEELAKLIKTKYCYKFSTHDAGLNIEGIITPVYKAVESTRKSLRGKGTVKTLDYQVIDWLISVKASTSNWVELTPSDIAEAHSSLFRHIGRYPKPLKGFEFVYEKHDAYDSKDKLNKKKMYKIVKEFSKTFQDLNIPYETQLTSSHVVWALALNSPKLVANEMIDITPELQAQLGNCLVEYRLAIVTPWYDNPLAGTNLTVIERKSELSTWQQKLSVYCPYREEGFFCGQTKLIDVVLFYAGSVVGNRDLCAGCAHEFKCMAKQYEGGGYKLEYHLSQLTPKALIL